MYRGWGQVLNCELFLRRAAPVSPLLAHALESLFPFLRTHGCYMLGGRRREGEE